MAVPQKRSYLFVYDSENSRGEMKEFIRKMSSIREWRFDLPNCFYVTSFDDAKQISSEFKRVAGDDHGRFIISEISSNKQGWLPPASWHIINKNELKPKNE